MSGSEPSGGYFGRSVLRKEDPALLTGRGRFVDDMQPDRLRAPCIPACDFDKCLSTCH